MSMPLWRKLVEKDWNLLQSVEPRNMHERGKKWLKHDLVESGPALIAMKGLPCTGKSCCASDIATFLRCPHLDIDDITICTRQTTHHHLLLSTDPEVATSACNHLDELSHLALLQFASTQLLLGHDVVIDSPLSGPDEMQQLVDLADSNSVPLIVIECVVISKSKWRRRLMTQSSKRKNSSSSAFSGKLEVGCLLEGHRHPHSFDRKPNDVPLLVIDTAQDRYSAADKLEDVILKFILLYKQNLGSNCKSTAISSNEPGREGERLKRHFSHSHPLTFIPEKESDMDSPAVAPRCRICLLHITGSSYNCPRCDFTAHESCIELPQYTSFPLHIHPLGLYVQSFDTNGSEEDVSCIVCNGANKGPLYRCWQCYRVFVHPKCAQLSHELKHPCHDHTLKLETYNLFPSRNQFTCCACGHKGGKISYGCSACKLKLHIACALDLPLETEYTCAQSHPLVLAPPPKNDLDEYYCDICEEERYGDYWIYYCRSCEFHAHLNCVNPDIQAYDIAEAKNTRDDLSDKVWLESDDDDEEEEEDEEDEEGDDEDNDDEDEDEDEDDDDEDEDEDDNVDDEEEEDY